MKEFGVEDLFNEDCNLDELANDYQFDNYLIDFLENEYKKYNGDYYYIDSIADICALFTPDWYLDVIRRDFPNLFVD